MKRECKNPKDPTFYDRMHGWNYTVCDRLQYFICDWTRMQWGVIRFDEITKIWYEVTWISRNIGITREYINMKIHEILWITKRISILSIMRDHTNCVLWDWIRLQSSLRYFMRLHRSDRRLHESQRSERIEEATCMELHGVKEMI